MDIYFRYLVILHKKGEDDEVCLVYETKRRASVLVGLNGTNQVAAHCEILSKSVFRHSAAVNGLSTIMKRLVSYANSRIFEQCR